MFNRIKSGVTAIAAVMSSFLWASCDKFWDDNPKKFGPTTYGPIFEANYNEYCQKYYGNNDFYACLCEKSIELYANNNRDVNDYEDAVQAVGNKFEKDIKFAEQNCCQDLKPDEMNNNSHYCDVPAIACDLAPVDLGCKAYSKCIYDVLVNEDGKDRCKTNDSGSSSGTEAKPEEPEE